MLVAGIVLLSFMPALAKNPAKRTPNSTACFEQIQSAVLQAARDDGYGCRIDNTEPSADKQSGSVKLTCLTPPQAYTYTINPGDCSSVSVKSHEQAAEDHL